MERRDGGGGGVGNVERTQWAVSQRGETGVTEGEGQRKTTLLKIKGGEKNDG